MSYTSIKNSAVESRPTTKFGCMIDYNIYSDQIDLWQALQGASLDKRVKGSGAGLEFFKSYGRHGAVQWQFLPSNFFRAIATHRFLTGADIVVINLPAALPIHEANIDRLTNMLMYYRERLKNLNPDARGVTPKIILNLYDCHKRHEQTYKVAFRPEILIALGIGVKASMIIETGVQQTKDGSLQFINLAPFSDLQNGLFEARDVEEYLSRREQAINAELNPIFEQWKSQERQKRWFPSLGKQKTDEELVKEFEQSTLFKEKRQEIAQRHPNRQAEPELHSTIRYITWANESHDYNRENYSTSNAWQRFWFEQTPVLPPIISTILDRMLNGSPPQTLQTPTAPPQSAQPSTPPPVKTLTPTPTAPPPEAIPLRPASPALATTATALQAATSQQPHTPVPQGVPDAKGSNECKVCFERGNTHIFLPCAHQCVCKVCGDKILQTKPPMCPICQGPITDCKQVFKC